MRKLTDIILCGLALPFVIIFSCFVYLYHRFPVLERHMVIGALLAGSGLDMLSEKMAVGLPYPHIWGFECDAKAK